MVKVEKIRKSDKKMKNALFKTVLMAVLILAISVGAEPISINLGGGTTQSPATTQPSTRSDTVKLVARGIGNSTQEALKDAYRDAVERAVGLFVDAESIATNNELVHDQILTHSNAYVTHYDIVKEESLEGGLVQLRIVATVQKRALTQKLTGTLKPEVVRLGGILADVGAQIVSQGSRANDAAALMEKTLKEINPFKQLIKPGLYPETLKTIEGPKDGSDLRWFANGDSGIPEGKVGVSYIFKFELDRGKYFSEIVPKLKTVLDQISLEQPKNIRLSAMSEQERDSRLYYMKEYFKGGEKRNTRCDVESGGNGFFNPAIGLQGVVGGRPTAFHSATSGLQMFFNEQVEESHYFMPGPIDTPDRDRFEKAYVVLITQLNEQNTMGMAVRYLVDKKTAKVVNEWFVSLGCTQRHQSEPLTYNVIWQDSAGNDVALTPLRLSCNILVNFASGVVHHRRTGGDNTPIGDFYFTPFVGGVGPCFTCWHDFVFSTEELSKIKNVKIELAE